MAQTKLVDFFGQRKRKEERADDEAESAKKVKVDTHRKREVAQALFDLIPSEEWRNALQAEHTKDYWFHLAEFVASERRKVKVYPPEGSTFAALEACPLSQVKVVIVGQDPYHGPGQAHGLAFSIASGSKCAFPPSLKNIVDEVGSDVKAKPPLRNTGDLTPWAARGVLLLNTVLTVRHSQANSHKGKGWERFTDSVIAAVNERPGNGVVFLLWGKPAQTKCANINRRKHKVITTSHPSPLSNSKTNSPFTSSKCFSRCNSILVNDLGYENGINWDL